MASGPRYEELPAPSPKRGALAGADEESRGGGSDPQPVSMSMTAIPPTIEEVYGGFEVGVSPRLGEPRPHKQQGSHHRFGVHRDAARRIVGRRLTVEPTPRLQERGAIDDRADATCAPRQGRPAPKLLPEG